MKKKPIAAVVKPAGKSLVTLRDIASHLGVSRTTVSLALKNQGRISGGTRSRILDAAKALGYQPDPTVSRLMAHLRIRRQGRARETIALLNNYPERFPWRGNVHLNRVHEGLHQRASALGFAMEDFWQTQPGMTPRRITGILQARGINGVVMLGFPQVTRSLDFGWQHFACCTIGHSLALPVHRVCAHQYRELFNALRQLALRGYRRVGLILNADVDQRVEHYYLAAYLVAQSEREERDRLEPLIFREGRSQFCEWFARQRPDAILLAQPPPSVGEVRAWIREVSKAKNDVALALLDLRDESEGVSGIRQSYHRIAAAAVDLVSGQLMRGETGIPAAPYVIKIEGEWWDGESTPPVG
jgi:LacI family transcriptional regulator